MTIYIPALSVEEVVEAVREMQPVTPVQIALHFRCSAGTVQRKLDGALYQKLVIVDDHSPEGKPLIKPHWRYAINEGV
jgi:hypothetical protein